MVEWTVDCLVDMKVGPMAEQLVDRLENKMAQMLD